MLTRAILLLAAASLVWGSGWILTPLLAQVAAPYASAALLLGAASLVFAPFTVPGRPAIPAGTTLSLSLAMFAVPTVLLTAAGQHGAAGWPALLYAGMPLLLGLARGRWSAAGVVAIGAVLVLLNGTVPFAPSRLPWALAAFAAVLCQAWALLRIAGRMRGQVLRPILGSLAVQCALAAGILALCSFTLDPAPRLASAPQWTSASGLALLVLGAAVTAFPYGAVYWLLANAELRPQQIAVTQWWQTLAALAESICFAHVRPSSELKVAAAVLAVCSVAELRASESTPEIPLTLRGAGLSPPCANSLESSPDLRS